MKPPVHETRPEKAKTKKLTNAEQAQREEYFGVIARDARARYEATPPSIDTYQFLIGDSTCLLPDKKMGPHIERFCHELATLRTEGSNDPLSPSRVDPTRARTLNNYSYKLAGQHILELRPLGSSKRARYDIRVREDSLRALVELGIQRQNFEFVPFDFAQDGKPYLDATKLANDFICGRSKDVGFIHTIDLRTAMLVHAVLMRFDHPHQDATFRSEQLRLILSQRLSKWNLLPYRGQNMVKAIGEMYRPVGAACLGAGPQLFFPEQNELDVANNARQVCAGCGVKDECLEFAISHKITQGIWGGKTSTQIKRAIIRRRIAMSQQAKEA